MRLFTLIAATVITATPLLGQPAVTVYNPDSVILRDPAAQNIEFRVQLKPDEEKTLTYTVHYTW